MYDFAHGYVDAIEGITPPDPAPWSSRITVPLYDWFLETSSIPPGQGSTSSPGSTVTYTVLSKRKLLELGLKAVRIRMGRSKDAYDSAGEKAGLHTFLDTLLL
jgi:hypothetical protein